MTIPSELLNQVVCMHALELLAMLPDESVDAIISDPPYNTTHLDWDKPIDWSAFWVQARRVLSRKNSPVILFSTQPFTTDLIVSNRAGFRYEWIWAKSNGGGFLNANRQPLKRHENILVFADSATDYTPQKVKGEPYSVRRANAGGTTRDQSVAGWLTVNEGDRYPTTILEYSNDTGLHPTQKPLDLLKYLVLTYTCAGDVVLDPFAGSGTTLVAARELGRQFVGCDISQEYVHEIAGRRLAMPYTLPMMFEAVQS